MKKFMKPLALLLIMSFISAQDCVDSEGIAGQSCDMIINTFGMSCDDEFAGTLISDACPVSCDSCPSEGPSGCDLPDMSLSILADGSVLYNTSELIGGFHFTFFMLRLLGLFLVFLGGHWRKLYGLYLG